MSPAYGCALLTFRLYRDYRDISRLSKHSSFTSGLGEFTQREFLGACRWRSVHTNSVCQGSSSWVWLLMLVAPELTFIFMFKLPTIFTFWFGLFGFCLQPFVACPTSAEISQETIVLLACFRSPLPDKTPRSHLRTRREGVFVCVFLRCQGVKLEKTLSCASPGWGYEVSDGPLPVERTIASTPDLLLMLMVCTCTVPFRTIILDGKQCAQLTRTEPTKKVDLVDVFPRCRQYDKTWKTVWNGCIMRTSSLVQSWKGVCDGIKDSKAFVDHVWPHQRRGAATTLVDFNRIVNSEQIRSWTSWELQRQWRSPEGTNGVPRCLAYRSPTHYWKDHDTDTQESLQGCSLWICVEANFMKERPDARTFMDTGFDRFSEILKGSCPRWNCDRFFFTRLRV